MTEQTNEVYPEGPYDELSLPPRPRLSDTELARFIDFIERFEDETDDSLSMTKGYRELRMMIHVMRNHLNGRLVTPTSLADASGLSYGTAKRGIEAMIRRGLILSRPRTKSGKTMSLHPSRQMIAEWEGYAKRIKTLLGDTLDVHPGLGSGTHVFLEGPYHDNRPISPPAVLSKRLDLKGGLRVLIHFDPTFMAMHNLKRQLEAIFGLEIKNKAKSIDGLRDEILANADFIHSHYDVVACDLPWFGELASKDVIMPLDTFIERDRYDMSDFYPAAVHSARYAGKQFGIPILTTPELLCYRRDRLEALGLEPPTTTEELIKVARRLHDPTGQQYGIAWNAARGTPLGHSFAFMIAAFGQPIINLGRLSKGFDFQNISGEQYRPMFLSDAAFRTCKFMLDLMSVSPPNILDMSWYERARSYASGQSCMAYCYTLLAPLFELNDQSPSWKNTGYLPHPTGCHGPSIAPIGGFALAIPSNLSEERIDAAWMALRHLTCASLSKLYIINGSLVSTRFSVSRDPEVSAVSPLIEIVDRMARTNTFKIWPRPPVPEFSSLIKIAGEEIHKILSDRCSIKQALTQAQNQADTLMRSQGYY